MQTLDRLRHGRIQILLHRPDHSFSGLQHSRPLLATKHQRLPSPYSRRRSDVDYHVTPRRGAADQGVSLKRRVEWIRLVRDGPGDQSALAFVTYTGAAGPADPNVTGLGQLQNAPVCRRIPACGDATARKRYQRTLVRLVFGRMRSACRAADDARIQGLAPIEDFGVNLLRRHTQVRKRLFHVRHEAWWSAEIDVRLSGDTRLIEHRLRRMTGRVETLIQLVARVWRAIADIAAAMAQREHETAGFGSERMMFPVARRMHPQDLSCRPGRGQRVQHCQNGRRANSRAKEHHRPFSRLENETPAWRADIEHIARLDMLPQVGSRRTMRLDLHTDPIAFRRK